jgi:UDP-N-acetylglucosamine 2-epimerase (non-hydrolysing)
VALLRHSTVILTDSGGIQEEAPSLGVPLVVMRDTTERPEGVEAGLATLVGTDRQRIVDAVLGLLGTRHAAGEGASRGPDGTGLCAPSPYGDGHAAQRIVSAIERYLDPRQA